MKGRILVSLCVLGVAAPAAAWDPFVTPNEHIEDGNERMSASDAENALRHYDQAARQLPNEAGVHLNRGLALLESGELDAALEAFETASEPSAPREIRADAYYDAGLAHYQLGNAAASEENHEDAQRLFREAADAFRRSLRMRPGSADAGWNLELALRRIREQEEQQEQEDQEQEGEDQESQDGDQESQDGDQEGQEEEAGDEEESPEDAEGSGDDDPSPQDRPPSEDEESAAGTDERSMPPEHRRVLDALRDSEENLQRHRARARGQRERRRVEQDW